MAVIYSQPPFSIHSLPINTTRTHSLIHAASQLPPNKEALNAELPYHLEPPDDETPPPIPATWPSAVRLGNSHIRDMLFVSIDAKICKASRDESTHLGISIFDTRLKSCLVKTDAMFQADTAIRLFHLTYQEDKDDWRCLQKMELFKLGETRLVGSKDEFCEWLKARISKRNWLLIVHANQNKFRYLRNIGNFNSPDAVISTKAMHELRGVIENEVYVAGNEAYQTLKEGLRIVIRDTLPFARFDSQSVAATKTLKTLQKIVENPSRIEFVTRQKTEEIGCQTVDAVVKEFPRVNTYPAVESVVEEVIPSSKSSVIVSSAKVKRLAKKDKRKHLEAVRAEFVTSPKGQALALQTQKRVGLRRATSPACKPRYKQVGISQKSEDAVAQVEAAIGTIGDTRLQHVLKLVGDVDIAPVSLRVRSCGTQTTMATKKITKLLIQRDLPSHIRSPTKSTKIPLKFRFAPRSATSKKSNEPKKAIPAPHNTPDCRGLLPLSLVAPQPPLWPELLGEFHHLKFYAASKTSQKKHNSKEFLPLSLVVSREPPWPEIFDHDSSVRDTAGDDHSDVGSDSCPSLDYEMCSSGSENGIQSEHDSATYRSDIPTHTEDNLKKTVWKDDFQDAEYSAIEPSLYLEMSRLALHLERLDLGKTD